MILYDLLSYHGEEHVAMDRTNHAAWPGLALAKHLEHTTAANQTHSHRFRLTDGL